jgi:hypothetical protein
VEEPTDFTKNSLRNETARKDRRHDVRAFANNIIMSADADKIIYMMQTDLQKCRPLMGKFYKTIHFLRTDEIIHGKKINVHFVATS